MEQQSRKKSCRNCRQAKTKCSLDTPQCLRCLRKNLSCSYEPPAHHLSTPPVASGDGGMFHSWLMATEPSGSEVRRESSGLPLDLDFTLPSTPTLQEMYGADMEWNESQPTFQVPAVSMGFVGEHPEPHPESEKEGSNCWFEIPSTERSGSTPRRSVPIAANQDYDLLSALSLTLKKGSPVKWEIFRKTPESLPILLNRKPATDVTSMVAGNSIWASVKECIPRIADEKPGLFIHSNADFKDEALANCSSIVSMYIRKTPACTMLVQKTLLLEVQRLYDEFKNYDEKGLLRALQALTLYMVTLAIDTQRCKVLSMVSRIAMGEMATQSLATGYLSTSEKQGNFPSWEEFICAESKRRAAIILHLLDMILNMNIGGPKSLPSDCTNMGQIPLPCSKALWEATTTENWEEEYKNYLSGRKRGQMLMIGDLQRCKDADVDTLEKGLKEDLETWSAGMDSFGQILSTSLLLCR